MALSHTFILLIVYFLTFANSNIDKDKEECADTLVGIATCLPYVSGDAKAPTLDCCSGLRNVLKTSKKCLCVLVKDRNDPGLGLKINATLALSLPTTCHSPANISECPYSGGNNDLWPAALLHLAPNSPDSKVFEDFAKNNESSNANDTHAKETPNTTSTTGSSAKLTNEGGTGKSWLGVEMFSFITTSTMVYLLLKI